MTRVHFSAQPVFGISRADVSVFCDESSVIWIFPLLWQFFWVV